MIALTVLAGLAGPLTAFDPWVGHCWVADIASETTDRHCFTAVYGGRHVRDTHEVVTRGKAVYAGETLYSVEDGKVTFTYWNSTGAVMRGDMIPSDVLRFRTRNGGLADSSGIVVIWRRTADGYETEVGNQIRRFRRDDR